MAIPSEAEIRDLSPEERIQLIELLWASFVQDPDSLPVSAEQRAELQGRLAEHEADPGAARPWSEVRGELESEWTHALSPRLMRTSERCSPGIANVGRVLTGVFWLP